MKLAELEFIALFDSVASGLHADHHPCFFFKSHCRVQ